MKRIVASRREDEWCATSKVKTVWCEVWCYNTMRYTIERPFQLVCPSKMRAKEKGLNQSEKKEGLVANTPREKRAAVVVAEARIRPQAENEVDQ